MNKRAFIYPFLLLTLLALIGCGETTEVSPSPTTAVVSTVATETPLEFDAGLNLLIDGVAQTQLKRSAWDSYQPAGFGASVQRGDLILPPDGTAVTILCADLTVQTISKEGGLPCEANSPALTWEGSRIVNPRAPDDNIPYIIYPRKTDLLETHPLLRWHDTGAGSYTVAIIQGGQSIWEQTDVRATELRYPDDAPSIESGVDYLLEVTDDIGASSGKDPVKGLGFQRLSPEETAAIMEKRTTILALPLDDAGQQFTLAVYYAGQGLYGEALDVLNEIIQTQVSPQLLLWNGHLLLATRLNNDAQAAYIEALILAEAVNDLESQAEAQTALWRITGEQHYLDSAVALYEKLGDGETAVSLQNEQ